VLYRRARLTLNDSTTRWFSDTPDVAGSTSWGNRLPRIVTLARFTDLASGRAFGLADCHLEGAPAAARHRSAAALATWLDPALPWIVLGDFNAEPDDEAIHTLLAIGLRDTFADGPHDGATAPATPRQKSPQRTDSRLEAQPALETHAPTRTSPAAPPGARAAAVTPAPPLRPLAGRDDPAAASGRVTAGLARGMMHGCARTLRRAERGRATPARCARSGLRRRAVFPRLASAITCTPGQIGRKEPT
jgi:hypothetical protein